MRWPPTRPPRSKTRSWPSHTTTPPTRSIVRAPTRPRWSSCRSRSASPTSKRWPRPATTISATPPITPRTWKAPSPPTSRPCCSIPATRTPNTTWSWPCSSKNNSSRTNNSRNRTRSSSRIRNNPTRASSKIRNSLIRANSRTNSKARTAKASSSRTSSRAKLETSSPTRASRRTQQSQDGEGQQDPQDGQPGEGDPQEAQPDPQQEGQLSDLPQPGQRMTEEQARQLLAAIARDGETLQERLGQIFSAPWRPPVQDW